MPNPKPEELVQIQAAGLPVEKGSPSGAGFSLRGASAPPEGR